MSAPGQEGAALTSAELADGKLVVIIPTYNNHDTLAQVLDGVLQFPYSVMVVNDGSTDNTAELLKAYEDKADVQHFEKNRGKGYALIHGFRRAIERGFEYAITIDSDGQHYPDDIPVMVNKLLECPRSLIVGSRNMTQENVPGKSSFGNKFSSFWFWAETGISLPDTQSGYRVYPLRPMHSMKFYTPKFEFEIEVMVRLAWKGVSVTHQPIKVYYPPADERVSHFRPFKDFTRISLLNTVLFTLAALYFRPLMIIRSATRENIVATVKKYFREGSDSRKTISASVGLGLFMGIFPAWGWQMIIAFGLASWFKLNRVIVLAASNISIPPFIPFILFLSYATGAIVLGHKLEYIPISEMTFAVVKNGLWQYVVGSTVFATIAGILGFGATYLLLVLRGKRKRKVS